MKADVLRVAQHYTIQASWNVILILPSLNLFAFVNHRKMRLSMFPQPCTTPVNSTICTVFGNMAHAMRPPTPLYCQSAKCQSPLASGNNVYCSPIITTPCAPMDD